MMMKGRVLSISPEYGRCLCPLVVVAVVAKQETRMILRVSQIKIQVAFQSPHNVVRTMRERIGRGSDNDRVAGSLTQCLEVTAAAGDFVFCSESSGKVGR